MTQEIKGKIDIEKLQSLVEGLRIECRDCRRQFDDATLALTRKISEVASELKKEISENTKGAAEVTQKAIEGLGTRLSGQISDLKQGIGTSDTRMNQLTTNISGLSTDISELKTFRQRWEPRIAELDTWFKTMPESYRTFGK